MRKVSVLIVEDQFAIAEYLRLHLVDFGFDVLDPVDNGEDAIEVFKKNRPDLVLMDIEIAGDFDGIETAKKINKLQPTPIIYITGMEDDQVFKRATDVAQPDAFLYKPVQPKMLHRQMDLAMLRYQKEEKYLKDSFFVSDKDHQYMRVEIDDLVSIRAARSFCDIYTETRKFTIFQSLNSFLEKYNHLSLVRIHRSHAVNIEKVEGIMGNQLIINGEYFDIGKSYVEYVKRRLNIF